MKTQEKKWPCVKCAESTFKKKIAPKLKKYGYKFVDMTAVAGDVNIYVVNFGGVFGDVTNSSSIYDSTSHDRYLCRTIPEFIEATKALAEARRQFRELTKHYTVEELSKNEPPRSWEEYLEQNPTEDTAELDKKLAALRKLRLMRDTWVKGCEGGNIFSIIKIRGSSVRTVATITQTYCALSFPTQKMANDFLNTFRDLIDEAGDLI